ncbi:hypothetical protein [Streptomyces sp. NPDC054783]
MDVGKGHHWAVAINAAGEAVFSRKISTQVERAESGGP